MIIKRTILFAPENRKKAGKLETENAPIRMRVSFGGERSDFATGFRIDIAKWDPDKQRVKNGCTNKLKQTSTEINTELQRYELIIQNIFREYEMKEQFPTHKQIREAFKERVEIEKPAPEEKAETGTKKKEGPTFWELIDKFMAEEGREKEWVESTRKKFTTMKNHLRKFDPHLTFEAIDEDKINQYVTFLLRKQNLCNNSVDKQLQLFGWYVRWAFQKKFHTNMTFERYRPKIKKVQKTIVFLTKEEIAKLRECKIPEGLNYLERARDVYLFCCFTGLRWSDVENLRRSDIKKDFIEIATLKTSDRITIELNDVSRSILEKYKDIPYEGDRALPVISNQKMNDYLKMLGKLAGIDTPVHMTYFKGANRVDYTVPKYEVLSTHTGRKTFISNALQMGIPPEVVMKWTGHSGYRAMKPYIAIADRAKAEAMRKFNEL